VNPCLSDDILCAYLDGAIAPKDAIGVSEHMAECATCAARLRELGQMMKLMGAALDAELSKDAPTERLRARFTAFLNEASAPSTPAETMAPSLFHSGLVSAPRLLEWLGGSFRRLAFASVMVVSIAIVVALAIGAWRSGSLKTGSGEKATQAVNSTDSTNSRAQTPDQARGKPAIGEQATTNNHQEHTVSARADMARPAHVNLENRAPEAKPKESPLPSGEPGEPPYVASTMATGDRNVSVVLDVETAKHVEKAQSLFHSVINMPSSNGKAVLDVTYEKRLSRRLFINNTLLSRRAEIQGDWAAGELLSRLEPFLLDIANLPDKPSPNKVRLIKELMRGAVSSL
jgi:anti-sigma factor RsiW